MTGSHEVRGSIPLGSTNHFKQFSNKRRGPALFCAKRQGKTLLVQLRDVVDPETGQRYTVKRYESQKVETDGSWQHSKITLKPVNPEFEVIEISEVQEGQLQVIAECIEVLGTPLEK